ncbi:MAG: acetyltransferase [Methylotenera sp. RIFCSPLOWO2_02_FULL_45_14]|nr:MAG: acetyltransferase [Methylotenera sp. RIFCSPLOWO2_02_FULL_45_14]
MLNLSQFFKKLRDQKKQKKLRNKPVRSLARFREQYHRYTIGANCYGTPIIKFQHPESNLKIGSYCSIAKNVQIFLGGNHRTDWISTYPFPAFFKEAEHIKDFETTRGDVVIGSDVWLCENCTILSGVTIGHGAVVANGAIVTKDVAPYAVVGGNPAKHIRWRFDEITRVALLKSAWWDWPQEEILKIAPLLCSNNITDFLGYAGLRNQQLKIK